MPQALLPFPRVQKLGRRPQRPCAHRLHKSARPACRLRARPVYITPHCFQVPAFAPGHATRRCLRRSGPLRAAAALSRPPAPAASAPVCHCTLHLRRRGAARAVPAAPRAGSAPGTAGGAPLPAAPSYALSLSRGRPSPVVAAPAVVAETMVRLPSISQPAWRPAHARPGDPQQGAVHTWPRRCLVDRGAPPAGRRALAPHFRPRCWLPRCAPCRVLQASSPLPQAPLARIAFPSCPAAQRYGRDSYGPDATGPIERGRPVLGSRRSRLCLNHLGARAPRGAWPARLPHDPRLDRRASN